MNRIDDLLRIMERLRDPDDGCPWDREQTFETIAPYTIEEAYEVEDAIARRDRSALRDELGDLLLQVVYHAQMAREAGNFAFDDVVDAICEKLVRRHPHVFSDATVESSGDLKANWDELKAVERAGRAAREGREPGVLDDVPLALPALLRAGKLLRRAARAGVDDAPHEQSWTREAGPGEISDEQVGDGLLAIVRRATASGIEAEEALRAANRRFEQRVRAREPDSDP
ncbi:MAG: nucleoside triphosphate pyrophosphohydrolase [bacterium]|nr:nucleoside triphosphate pyrophosphohydrolase [bacterium]